MPDPELSARLRQDLAEASLYQAARQYVAAAGEPSARTSSQEQLARERARERALRAAAAAYCAAIGHAALESDQVAGAEAAPRTHVAPEDRERSSAPAERILPLDPDTERALVAARYRPATARRLLHLARVLPEAEALELLALVAGVDEEAGARSTRSEAAVWQRVLAHVPGLARSLEAVREHALDTAECPTCGGLSGTAPPADEG